MPYALLELGLNVEPAAVKDVEHARIRRQHVGREAGDASRTTDFGEAAHQDRADAFVLPGVGHDEGDVGKLRRRVDVVAAQPDDFATVGRK